MKSHIARRASSQLTIRAAATALLLGSGQSAGAAVANFVTIDVPGAALTRPNDVNDAGVIVGFYRDSTGAGHGFVRDGGSFTTIDYPGASETALIGINDAGELVGRFKLGGVEHGFRLSNGDYTAIDFPGAVDTQCHGINLAGQIVGRYLDNKNGGQGGGAGHQHEHGFLLDNGVFTSLDYPDSATTDAWRVTALGDVIGDWSSSSAVGYGFINSGAVHGYALHDGVFTSEDYPGALITSTRERNATGQWVGIYVDKKFVDHGFVRDAGQYQGFDFPGAAWTDGSGINDGGLVVGSYQDAAGKERGFVASIRTN